jgi:phosphatidyl-myo-inositol dimannoside synthase
MRKVLLLTLDFPPRRGGVARYLHGIASYWSKQVFVIAPPEIGSLADDQNSPFTIKRTPLLFNRFWPRWLKSFFIVFQYQRRFDTLWVSHILPLGTVALISKILLRKEYFVFLHSMDFALATRDGWKCWLTSRILKNASLVVTNSAALEERVKQFADHQIKALVLYPFIHPEMMRVGELRNRKTEEPKNTLTLLTVARLVGRKGHYKVLDAMSKLAASGVGQIQYHIVGTGLEYTSLVKYVQKLGLEPLVRFYQDVSDEELSQVYQQADIYVMPTEVKGPDMEGFGIVYLEAGLSGLPVIGSQLSGVNEAVVHGQTGILVEAGNSDKIAIAIKYLKEHPEVRQQYGQAGRDRVLKEFCCQAQAKKLEPYML